VNLSYRPGLEEMSSAELRRVALALERPLDQVQYRLAQEGREFREAAREIRHELGRIRFELESWEARAETLMLKGIMALGTIAILITVLAVAASAR
jgi:hypothetical protein